MAWREIPESRQYRRARSRESGAVIHTGQRIYTGDVSDLLANAPVIDTCDFPYVSSIGVSSVDIVTLNVSAAGIPQGRMTVDYEWNTPAAMGRYKEGYRKDEFNCAPGSMSFSQDLQGKPVIRYEYIASGPNAGKYKEVAASLETQGGSALLTIYVVTNKAGKQIIEGSGNIRYTSALPLKWARHIGWVNSKAWMGAKRGEWAFMGARIGELEIPGQVVSSPTGWIQDTIPEVWLSFAYNSPGWNADQFGTKAGGEIVEEPVATQPAATQPSNQPESRQKARTTVLLNYQTHAYMDFEAMFPMVRTEGDLL